MKIKKNKGTTLVEIMVATLIFVMLLGGLYGVLTFGSNFWQGHVTALQAQRDVKNAVTVLTRDLREANNIVLSQDASNVSLTYTNPVTGGTVVTWTTVSSSPDVNRVLRQNSGETRIIAQNISSFIVTDDSDDITINLTANVESDIGQGNAYHLIKKITKR